MSLETLVTLVPPPMKPVFTGTRQEWNQFEAKYGINYPDEYFHLSMTYGSGEFFGSLEVGNPFDPSYQDWVEFQLSPAREVQKTSLESVPYSLYPEKSGIFPVARDDNGNYFYWSIDANLKPWPIICHTGRGGHWDKVHHSLTEFLVLAATNQLSITRGHKYFWGRPFEKDDMVFIPRKVQKRRGRK